jgi:hypothetical protein
MSADRLQSARYEFKYIIDDRTATRIREFVLTYLKPDHFTVGREGIGYAVHSLYLDSKDLTTCQAVLQGAKNRYKLRLRFYDDDPKNPVFFEVKRRVNLVILKKRASVKRERVDRLLAGAPPRPEDLLKNDKKNWQALLYFCQLRDQIHAVPAAYTSYMREGYERADNNAVRVTFDRFLRSGRFNGKLSVADIDTWPMPHVGGVVLELKFTDRFPEWMHDLVQLFNLTRGSCPKYVKCITLLNGRQED